MLAVATDTSLEVPSRPSVARRDDRRVAIRARRRPHVRLRSAPPLEPPFDDDGASATAGMQLLPLEWPALRDEGATPTARTNSTEASVVDQPGGPVRREAVRAPGAGRAPRPVRPGGPTDPADPAGPVAGPSIRATGSAAAHRFVNMAVEVLNGYRPVAHLRPLITAHRFTDVADQLVRRTVRVRISRAAQQLTRRIRVRRVLVHEPCAGVVEVAVVLDDGKASWAMALRLEHQACGWLCALVQVV